MNILIKNLSNTFNYGSMMMGENLITYLNSYCHINYHIEDCDEKSIERLKKATGYQNIQACKTPKAKASNNKILRFIYRKQNEKKIIKDYSKKYDYIFILGGDDYSEEYYDIKEKGKYVIQLLKKLQNINKKVPVYMLSQTIGPFTGKRLKVATNTFKKLKLYSRDNKNYNYLRNELKCNNVKRMYDLAFLDLHLQNGGLTNKFLKKYNLESEKYIVFVGTGLMNHYTSQEEDMVHQIEKLLKLLLEKYKNKKIVWLSHVVGVHSPDTIMLDQISEAIKKDLMIINDELLPYEARYILGNANFTITCRMHAAVSSLQMGKSCICLSYSPKFSGVVGEEFNLEKYVLEVKGTNVWKNDKVYEKVMDLTDLLDKEMKKLNSNIKNHIEDIKKQNAIIMQDLAKELESKND